MPLYDYRCPAGHYFERLAPMSGGDRADCPGCGATAAKVPSRVSLGGQASPGLSKDEMPQTWRGTHEGNPEYVGQLQRQWEGRRKLEEKYPELKGDQRPILAHEGRYHDHPLRAGDAPTTISHHDGGSPGAGG